MSTTMDTYAELAPQGKLEAVSIYSTNLIESLNKEIKRQTEKKVFPNEESLERYLVTLFEDYNFKQSQRIHKGGANVMTHSKAYLINTP